MYIILQSFIVPKDLSEELKAVMIGATFLLVSYCLRPIYCVHDHPSPTLKVSS